MNSLVNSIDPNNEKSQEKEKESEQDHDGVGEDIGGERVGRKLVDVRRESLFVVHDNEWILYLCI